jgi:hypothetical protein
MLGSAIGMHHEMCLLIVDMFLIKRQVKHDPDVDSCEVGRKGIWQIYAEHLELLQRELAGAGSLLCVPLRVPFACFNHIPCMSKRKVDWHQEKPMICLR